MRVHLFAPAGDKKYPAVIFFSEIFQVTGPIRRMAAALSGNGYLVAVPEVYHEFEPAGTVLAYDQAGSDRGNELKYAKELASYDEDARVTAEYLKNHPQSTGELAAMAYASVGIWPSGRISARCGSSGCILCHGRAYGFARGREERRYTGKVRRGPAAFFFVWGRQDPHVPLEGRKKIADRLNEAQVDFEWHEFNGAHAFLRDEGPRYNPSLARVSMDLLLRFFSERLG